MIPIKLSRDLRGEGRALFVQLPSHDLVVLQEHTSEGIVEVWHDAEHFDGVGHMPLHFGGVLFSNLEWRRFQA
jgi:hypothetical protein